MSTYVPELKGTRIAWGGDHFVYCYGADRVIKFSKIEFVLGSDGAKKARRDYDLAKKYFGDAVIDTEFLQLGKRQYFAKVQPRIHGHRLTARDLSDPAMRMQFRTIIAKYRQMRSDGYAPLDLIGGHGVFRKMLSNLFCTEGKELVIIDTTLMEAEGLLPGMLAKCIRFFAERRQEAIIAAFLKA
jgi:hypothetical protein